MHMGTILHRFKGGMLFFAALLAIPAQETNAGSIFSMNDAVTLSTLESIHCGNSAILSLSGGSWHGNNSVDGNILIHNSGISATNQNTGLGATVQQSIAVIHVSSSAIVARVHEN